jgi:hypothetical protein
MVSEMVQESPSFTMSFILLFRGWLSNVRRMEVELEVLRLETLPLNSLLCMKAQLVALQLKEMQWEFESLKSRVLFNNLLRRVELILAELRRREELIRRILVILWQNLLESFLFSGNVSEFPNNHRPPCTTMPWNIRPALVVLWGVCWMFNPWSPINAIQLQPLSAGEQTLFSNSGKVFPHSNVHLYIQLTFST